MIIGQRFYHQGSPRLLIASREPLCQEGACIIATSTPPAQRHADDARSSLASSEASWAAFFDLVSPRLVDEISYRISRITPPLPTNANPLSPLDAAAVRRVQQSRRNVP